jgi:glycolate oxidase iron-sulfur subunit
MPKISEEQAKALLVCNKCGFCLAHCPIYKVTGNEWMTARGRITMLRGALLEGKLDTIDIKDPAFNCLTCRACVDDCPAGVATSDIIFDAREEIVKRQDISLTNRMLFGKLLASPELLHKASMLLRLTDVLGLREAARITGLLNLLGDAGKASVMVPKIPAGKGILDIKAAAQKIENPKARVAYFVGCHGANLGTPEAIATIRLLNKQKVEVEVPDFVCCGLPASGYGETEAARKLVRTNLEIASKLNVDAVITACASCSSFLKDYGKLLADDPQWAEAAKKFSAKVKDFTEFLAESGPITGMRNINKKVTYHDPCHLGRYQKIKQQPRNLIKSIPGVQFVEMPEADMCCGAAGTYGFKNYKLSMKVLARKMDNVQKTGADILVSSCPACVMQLAAGTKKRKMPVQTMSLVQLLDLACSNDTDSPGTSTG